MDTNRFWKNVSVLGEDDCWLWKLKPNGSGYGVTSLNGKSIGAHVLSWMIANGEYVPDGYMVMHTCDTRLCTNPKHLVLGTQSDNMIDATRKGRNGNAKLRGQDVAVIKQVLGLDLNLPRKAVHRGLADRFGVSMNTIQRISGGSRWGWLEDG